MIKSAGNVMESTDRKDRIAAQERLKLRQQCAAILRLILKLRQACFIPQFHIAENSVNSTLLGDSCKITFWHATCVICECGVVAIHGEGVELLQQGPPN